MIRHLLVIGAQRSGTTYLQSLLDSHPDITMARPSRPEPKVFCSAEASAKGEQWYRETYFAHASREQLLGEKSTSYIEDAAAPARASAMLGEAHVVVMLRDPVERAVSNWRFSTENGLETRPAGGRAAREPDPGDPWDPEATSVSPFAYLERGRYIGLPRAVDGDVPAHGSRAVPRGAGRGRARSSRGSGRISVWRPGPAPEPPREAVNEAKATHLH